MTCELVTGSSGTEHVSSADAGSMYASVFGAGRYAVNQGDNFAAVLASSNSVQIGTGACFIDGRYFRVTSPETVSFDSGAQGVNRIDLVGVKYVYNSGTGVETGTLDVVKGTATSGTPEIPTYTDGNILEGATQAFYPLYSITITGVNAGDPVKLFHMMTSTVNCPWPVGSVLQMTNATNPNDVYPGTTWQKIQGAFLLGSSSDYGLGTAGGAESVTLTTANLPSHSHTYNKANATSGGTSITKAQLPSGITGAVNTRPFYPDDTRRAIIDYPEGVFSISNANTGYWGIDGHGSDNPKGYSLNFNLGGSSQAHTHSVGSTSTNSGSTGSGTAVSTMPPYKVVNMWERTA